MRLHEELFNERKSMLVPHLFYSKDPLIPWTWLEIWLIWPLWLSHLIFVFTKANQTHVFTSPPAISPDRNSTYTTKPASERDWSTLSGMETTLGNIKITAALYMHNISNILPLHPTSCAVHLSGLYKNFHWAIRRVDQQPEECRGGRAGSWGVTSLAVRVWAETTNLVSLCELFGTAELDDPVNK